MSEEGKRVLILGGTGFVGRHLVKELLESKIVSKIRVVDKSPPKTNYFNSEFEKIFSDSKVEFLQKSLVNETNVALAFKDDTKFDWVVNLAAETRFGQELKAYEQMIKTLSILCGNEAAKHGCEKYVELSTAQVYKPGKKLRKEDAELKPWTNLAKYKLEAEDE
jgi:nucleoside-diphosphate-sugar epimerase